MFACFIEIWQKKEIAKFQSNKTKPVLLLHKKIVIEFNVMKFKKNISKVTISQTFLLCCLHCNLAIKISGFMYRRTHTPKHQE